MARSREQLSVQLFPFLAVLVCVMGSLILLLLVTTRRLRTVAVAKAKSALVQTDEDRLLQPPIPQYEPPAILDEEAATSAPAWQPSSLVESPDHAALARKLEQDWKQRVQQLESAREARSRAVVRHKLLAAAMQQRIEELQAELRQLQTEYGRLTGQMSASNLQPASGLRERVQLEEQIANLRQQLKELEDQQRDNDGRFSIVPFDGKSGTTRRPILIECTATGLRFVAEDITLKPSDIAGFTERFNPLLAGSTALVNYWKQWNIDHPEDDAAADPYVLLLVRPSGTVAYYIAQRLLSPMRQPHGYELIAEDLPLAVPPSDPGAKVACEAAIARLLSERQAIAEAASGSGGFSSTVQKTTPAAPQYGHGEFQLDDVGDGASNVGERSWESPEQFGGQEYRRPAGSPANRTPAAEPAPLPEDTAQNAVPATAQPDRRWTERPAAEPRTGPQLRPDSNDREYPSFARTKASSRELPYEQLQRRRWGQHDPGASIGVEKTVVIRVDAQRLVVSDAVVIPVPLGATRNHVFDRLLTVIDDQAQTWGKPGSGFFWIPSLKFIISPGGNQVYERIVPLVKKCGLSTTAEFTLDEAATSRSGRQP